MSVAVVISILMLIAAVVIAMVRLYRGPHPVDRVLCLDLLALIMAALVLVFSVRSEISLLVDFALVFSIIAFIGTIVFARFIEGYLNREENDG